MAKRRDQLRERVLEYLLTHGVADATLRPLAQRVGSSARLLVYHFGSKEGLLTAAMEEVQSYFQRSFLEIAQRAQAKPDRNVTRMFWRWATRPANLRYFRLLFEIQILALQNPKRYARHVGSISVSWLDLIANELPADQSDRGQATLYMAVFDGLILELLASGDRRRINAGFREFIRLLTSQPARARNDNCRRK